MNHQLALNLHSGSFMNYQLALNLHSGLFMNYQLALNLHSGLLWLSATYLFPSWEKASWDAFSKIPKVCRVVFQHCLAHKITVTGWVMINVTQPDGSISIRGPYLLCVPGRRNIPNHFWSKCHNADQPCCHGLTGTPPCWWRTDCGEAFKAKVSLFPSVSRCVQAVPIGLSKANVCRSRRMVVMAAVVLFAAPFRVTFGKYLGYCLWPP